MKNFKYIILGCLLVLATSCKKWLDVNTDPDNPNNTSVLVQNRLPWMQHFYTYTAGVTNFRTSCQAGVYYSFTASANALSTTWTASSGNITPYQTWFVEIASNINDLYNKAQQQGAYYYMGAADVISALGFMEMLDLYGEMPYTQAISGIASPKYDNGETIYYGCMAKLDEAISLFSKTQAAGAPSFATGDMWNNGDPSKWIKLCYGLKARYMLLLSKKTDLFNADSILYCLSKGPQSNADNVLQPCFNNSSAVDYLIHDPIVTNGNWDYVGYGSNQRISEFYYNLLTNRGSSGVTDPRMTKIVPGSMSDVTLNSSGQVVSFKWNRSKGVDSYGPSKRLLAAGPATITTATYADKPTPIKYVITDDAARQKFIADQQQDGRQYTAVEDTVTVTYKTGSIYISSNDYVRAGDTIYVNLRSNSLATGGLSATDLNWYPSTQAADAGVIGSTGSFQVRPISDQEILTYHEMCFIKAEVYMRKGDKADAYTAYLDGIKANIDMMQDKLTEWKAAGYATTNPDMGPMDEDAISDYLKSDAVCQDPGSLTMSDIMLQKFVAMGCSLENYNDMRRFNFSAGNIGGYGVVYPGYDRGPLFAGASLYTGSSKTDPRYWQRRWELPQTLELNYNSTNALAINPHAADPNIWSMPVWWDCATDAEYQGYLK